MSDPTNNAIPTIRRILVLRTGHIGDTVLLTSALELLNQLFPGAEISVLLRAGAEPILQHHPLVKRIYTGGDMIGSQIMLVPKKRSLWQRLRQLPRGLRLIRELRRQRFDLAVDFSGGDRTALFAYFSGATRRIAYASGGAGFLFRDRLYTHVCPRPLEEKHKVWRDAELLQTVALATERHGVPGELNPGPTRMYCSGEAFAWAKDRWSKITIASGPRIVVHPASRAFYKCWPVEKWVALIGRLRAEVHANVLITGGPGSKDMAITQDIVTACQGEVPAQAGDVTLDRLAALIRQADLFLGVDTAPMHIAAAVGTRVVAVFGPSSDRIWRPWGPGHCVVRRPCPCLESGRRGCNEAEGMKCMQALTVEEVYEAARRILGETSAKGSVLTFCSPHSVEAATTANSED